MWLMVFRGGLEHHRNFVGNGYRGLCRPVTLFHRCAMLMHGLKQNNAGASQSETPALLCCICLSKRLFYTSKQLLISLQLLSRFNQASACPLRFSTRALNSSIVTSLLSIVTALRTASNIFINPTCCAIRERESLSASIRFA